MSFKNETCCHTNGRFTELFISDLVGDVCSHEDRHGDPQLPSDDLRDQLQTLGTCIDTLEPTDNHKTLNSNSPCSLVYCKEEIFQRGQLTLYFIIRNCYLDERHPYSVLLDVVFDGVAHSDNELVRDHKDQDVGPLHRLS